MKHHIIYIPGLGDRYSYGQNIAINWWRWFGLTPHYFALGWTNQEGFDAKLARLISEIDALKQHGDYVSLVGVSAGASAALNAYARHPGVTGVVYISGKINSPELVDPQIFARNPDFNESLGWLKESLAQLSPVKVGRILNIHPVRDQTVSINDTKIIGTAESVVPGWNHASGIFFGIISGAPIMAKFLHALEKRI